MSLACLVPASYAASEGDDYPYAGLGKCPLVPLPPKTDKPGKPGAPHAPGQPGQPGTTHGTTHGTTKPGTGPTKPGSTDGPATPPPPRQCAKHIWYYNGSYGDPWGFALRNCTSFVAWRLRETNGLDEFENHFGGVHWGNAEHWDKAARELGYRVDDVPAVGAVAQTDDGRVGHVAWVSAVGDGTVTVEEYNMLVAGGYDVRTVPTSSFTYLHLDDVSPSPYLGSTRAGTATTDAHSGTWSARTTDDGDLVVGRPSGRTTRLGVAGGWSPQAAPSVLTDAQGRIWVAGVTRAGQVRTAHTGLTSTAFGRPRGVLAGSPTSSPTLTLDGEGRVSVLAVSATGTLAERHTVTVRSERWTRAHRLGARSSWSTQAAPAATTDAHGRLWVVAVTGHGRLLAQHASGLRDRWSGFRPLDHRTWSTTSSPALADAADGRLWLATVDADGHLVVRHTDARSTRWQARQVQDGSWSPYSSPALAVDRTGRTWLAAVGTNGEPSVLWRPDGARRWRPSGGVPHVAHAETASPTLTTTVDGVLLGVTNGRGHLLWRRPFGQPGLPMAHGPHSGALSVGRYL